MRTAPRLLGYASLSCILVILVQTAFAQTNSPPSDPREMVTREPATLTKPADRSAALDLLDRARQNLNLHDISTPYALKVSFETSGTAQMEGEWTMDEISDGGSHWRWTAQLQDLAVIRIGADGRVYGTNPNEPVPLRVQLVRSALHWPITRNAGASAIREADVERDGRRCHACCSALRSRRIPRRARGWRGNTASIPPAACRCGRKLLEFTRSTITAAPRLFVATLYRGKFPFSKTDSSRCTCAWKASKTRPALIRVFSSRCRKCRTRANRSRWRRPVAFRCASIPPMGRPQLFSSP
jgi:hypothetical protein